MIVLTKPKYEIGARIRKYRESRKISQKELAAKLDVTNSVISNWEQGLNRPDADMLAKLCNALEVSPSELLNVHLATDDLTEKERRLITAYRSKPEHQKSIDTLLGID